MMQVGDPVWIALCLSIGANVAVWTYYHAKARRNTLMVIGTAKSSVPILIKWIWAVPFYGITLLTLLAPSWMDWSTIAIPEWGQKGGAMMMLTTPLLCWWVLRALGNNFAEAFSAVFGQKLITRGPYKYLRHPLYALESVFLFCITLALSNWLILAFALAGIMTIFLVVIPREEEFLGELFGKPYERYRKKTGMILPKIAGLGKHERSTRTRRRGVTA